VKCVAKYWATKFESTAGAGLFFSLPWLDVQFSKSLNTYHTRPRLQGTEQEADVFFSYLLSWSIMCRSLPRFPLTRLHGMAFRDKGNIYLFKPLTVINFQVYIVSLQYSSLFLQRLVYLVCSDVSEERADFICRVTEFYSRGS
jgi:hypothetical protein